MKLADTELTRLAATAIMGWIVSDANEDGKPLVYHPPQCPGRYVSAGEWSPLTNWAHAGDIVEKMRADGWLWDMEVGEEAFAVAYNPHEWTRPYARSEKLPRAITIAALQATGAITEDQL